MVIKNSFLLSSSLNAVDTGTTQILQTRLLTITVVSIQPHAVIQPSVLRNAMKIKRNIRYETSLHLA